MTDAPQQASAQQQARRQQRIEELCAASIRALAGDAQLHYRGGVLHRGHAPLRFLAPHLRDDSVAAGFEDFGSRRGLADAMALRLRHSDPALHRELAPTDPVERLVFEMLEQLRVETLAPEEMPGVAANLRHRFEQWSRAFHASRLTETRLGLLMYALAQSCWSMLNGKPPLAETEEIIETTRAKLGRALAGTLAGIRRERTDQRAFAAYALRIAAIVGAMVRTAEAQQAGEREARDDDDAPAAFALLLDFEQSDGDGIARATSGHSQAFAAGANQYRAWTTRYDREVDAALLVRRELLREYRQRLDQRIAASGIHLARLSRLLAAILATPRRDGWSFGEEEGYVDGARLAQLVSAPAERRLFRLERHRPVADCTLAFLVDCSGSMKEHIEPVAIVIDVMVRALEAAGAATEVLGFTTGAWNGGRPYREWLARGRPPHPGRLNEVLHMVFKSAERNWRRARTDVAALLKPDLFREGIDGEAVDWACARLMARAARRRILIVVSDGCPMDSATALANDRFYLDNHLKEVVARHEQAGMVEVLGLGVGLDLSPFYRRCLATDPTEPIGNELFLSIAGLIAGRRRR